MSFIFCLLLGVILWWIIKGIISVISMRNQFKSIFEQASRATGFNPADGRAGERKGGWSNPLKRRKKIDPEVGEYVRFTETETTVSHTASSDGRTTTTREEQVTDVEWEDV